MRRALFLAAGAVLLTAALMGEAQAGEYGLPRFDPGPAAYRAGTGPYFDGGPTDVEEYREPYIGTGLVYNLPPDPYLSRRRSVIRARS